MLSRSFAFRDFVARGGHLDTLVAISFADGSAATLHGEDITIGGLSFSAATSTGGRFDIGAAIIGSCSMTLANYDERWDEADFTGATATVSVGATFEDGTTEWLRKGEYGIQQPESYDSTITLECHDNMRLFQVPYSVVGTTYPATLLTIVTDICQACGVTMLSAGFPHDGQTVRARPEDELTSCLDVLSWAAQMAGCFCDMDPWGRLRVRWYDTAAFETEDWLDGGTFFTATTPYSDGDAADGGGFHYGGDAVNGGSFQQVPWAVISAIKSLSTTTDDVVVTGLRVVASDERRPDGTQGDRGETYLFGTDGYVLEISGNPLVAYGSAQSVATAIGPAIVGMRFRPLTVSSMGDPAIEAGDPALVVDRRGRTFRTWVTNITWKHGGIQSVACDAKTPARNQAEAHSAATRAIVQQRNAARAERTARELAVSQLARELSEAGGLYKTEQEQQDHSVIYYLHDKPTLAESQIVWKMTSAAFAVSVDGGVTYPFGFDAWGNAILNAIYAIGINASYINAGSLNASLITTGKIQSHNGKVYFDLTNNELHCDKLVSTGSGTIGNFTASIKSRTLYGNTIYGLSLDNSNYEAGSMTISPGSANGANFNYRPSIAADDGIYIIGGTGDFKARAYAIVAPKDTSTEGVYLEADGYYNGNREYGPSLWLRIPTSDSAPTYDMELSTAHSCRWSFNKSGAKIVWGGYSPSFSSLTVSGNKNRVVETEHYGSRLLNSYETPEPLFGDVGSAVLGDDGVCVVSIDDVFAECARTSMAYQVLLQKCGPGDLWVSEKGPTHFVVEGTAGLAFDWQVIAHQKGYETTRLEDMDRRDDSDVMGQEDLGALEAYEEELGYIEEIERLYEEAA